MYLRGELVGKFVAPIKSANFERNIVKSNGESFEQLSNMKYVLVESLIQKP